MKTLQFIIGMFTLCGGIYFADLSINQILWVFVAIMGISIINDSLK